MRVCGGASRRLPTRGFSCECIPRVRNFGRLFGPGRHGGRMVRDSKCCWNRPRVFSPRHRYSLRGAAYVSAPQFSNLMRLLKGPAKPLHGFAVEASAGFDCHCGQQACSRPFPAMNRTALLRVMQSLRRYLSSRFKRWTVCAWGQEPKDRGRLPLG
jgi:hypothetical protein